jgi:hypothetical protein
MIEDLNFKKLFENTFMILGHIFETAFLFNKITKEEFSIFGFDSDPTCGVVGKNNDWCLIGGNVLVIKTFRDKTLRCIGELKFIHELKIINDYAIQVLTDPWEDKSAIWQVEINLNNLSEPVRFFKVRDFIDYVGKPYEEKIKW